MFRSRDGEPVDGVADINLGVLLCRSRRSPPNREPVRTRAAAWRASLRSVESASRQLREPRIRAAATGMAPGFPEDGLPGVDVLVDHDWQVTLALNCNWKLGAPGLITTEECGVVSDSLAGVGIPSEVLEGTKLTLSLPAAEVPWRTLQTALRKSIPREKLEHRLWHHQNWAWSILDSKCEEMFGPEDCWLWPNK